MVTIAAAAAPFDRDLEAAFDRIARLIAEARSASVDLLVLPEATLGGYLADLEGSAEMPPALAWNGPEVRRLISLAGSMVITCGYCESDSGAIYNSAVCVSGDGVLGRYRKTHLPLREDASYSAGSSIEAFDTPVGRLGMLICHDKSFPEAARTLAVDGAEIVACMSAWPSSRTNAAPELADDRWTHRFDLYDRTRALENQFVWAASNQAGTFGSLRFVCSAKVVDPGGEVLATTGTAPGLAVASVDVAAVLDAARGAMFNLRDRRPELYEAMTADRGPGRLAVR